ncbi:WD repeat-containing protein 3-like isoform X2 [Portunus trituberculatus]|uniref:WD repeat-containing protein 3-like isoform X2 n=1 Tax=Portunus trituberculatus TaxID=210409 RepID=UPI001E1CC6EA|nr:WD repeat-containing protein 3-like isoform X2 [Portunus trituberculatus]
MGVTTQYLRYVPGQVFGLVGTGRCVRLVTRFSQLGKFLAVPACERVLIWDLRRETKVLTLDGEVRGTVTMVEPRPAAPGSLDNTHLAVGYSEGTVVVFDLMSGEPLKFTGHKGGVSSLCWDPQGMRVASGSEDGELVVWDVVSERGMVRLRGHKGKVTRVRFMQTRNVLVSSCRDTFIKLWDLTTHHCFRTLAGHRAEVWDFVLLKGDSRLVSGSSDAELRVWALNFKEVKKTEDTEKEAEKDSSEPPSKMFRIDTEGEAKTVIDDEEIKDDASIVEVVQMGSVLRSRGDRVCGLQSDGRVVACHGKGPVIDLFAVLTDEEVATKAAKRGRKERKRAREAGDTTTTTTSNTPLLADEIQKLPTLRAANKLLGVDVLTERSGMVRLAALHNDNSVALLSSDLNAKEVKKEKKKKKEEEETEVGQVSVLGRPGHRTEIRAVAFTSLSDQVVTGSAEALKVWNRGDTQATLTVPCGPVTTLVVVPGDRHALVGTRSGHLQLIDFASATLLEDILAHEPDETATDTGVWSVALTHDGRGFVSGGSDKMVKFWKFELVPDETGRGKRLSFLQDTRALKVADQVTCLRCSSGGRFLAVATLDLKETVYFIDSLKLCHELYGKSLPATCMDFSTDSTMLVTGSKDSSLRIYGTDFGDQRKLFKNAHQGGVTDIRFIPKTHMFFSCGHDSTVKQWDADNFQRIITLEGHTGIVRCLSVCPRGAWVLSGGQDRSLRLWERTQEPLVLEEEREEELKRKEEEEGTTATQRRVLPGEEGAQAVRPTVTTHHTEKAADMILEALGVYREQVESGGKAEPHYLMTYVYKTSDPLRLVLEVLRRVKSRT